MNYYLDTEFIEDFTSPSLDLPSFRWEHRKHYVDLISIGIVSEDNREYFAVSSEFDLKHAWNKYDLQLPKEMGDEPIKVYWLRENVLRPIWEYLKKDIRGDRRNYTSVWEEFTYKNLKTLIRWYGKTREQIAREIACFTASWTKSDDKPIFYGYFADYDWVVFCSLFGRMLDLPKGYPMYCRDLKQMMDELYLTKEWKNKTVPGDNEHHALADARWNKQLHSSLKQFHNEHIRLIDISSLK